MRFLSQKQVIILVIYSRAHIQRLEGEGKFPRRVRLGNGPRGRVAWVEDEIHEWMKVKAANR